MKSKKTFELWLTGISLLFAIFINSCYTVKETHVVDVKRIPGSDKVDGTGYSYDLINQVNPENPYVDLEVYQADKIRYKTQNTIERKWVKSMGLITVVGGGFALTSGIVCMNNLDWFENGASKADAFLAGVTIGSIPWLVALISGKSEKKDYQFGPGEDKFEYRRKEVLANADIGIKQNKMDLHFMSSETGRVKFSPADDFKLNTFKTNDSVTFWLSYNNQPLIKTLNLRPSDWLSQYARIISPRAQVFKSDFTSSLGTAREGVYYKLIKQNADYFKIHIGPREGWIQKNNAELIYTKSVKMEYSAAVKNYVTDAMQEWLKQGEFELPENYLQRLSKKDEQLLVFTNEAMKTFQKEYVELFNWNMATISRYDPNSQTFKINIPDLQEVVISVPIDKAPSFKENWSGNSFKNQEFTLIDGEWKLVSFEIEDPSQNYIARYDSQIANNYDPTNQFAFDLKDFEISIPDLSVVKQNNIPASTVEIDPYSIKTDLPVTGMVQPDAIAVVIGNALYQKTDPVNFAINDAQLMKLYLTNVLGFKEGNIIFTMNATKAEFEGLFGTGTNYKGKLFNYIKPNISDVFIFYSGHGAPDPETKDAYFLPSDCDPAYLELQGYALKTLYGNLAKLPARSTTVVLDACFSGGGVLKNISSVRIKPNDTEENIPNSAILSSSGGVQVSSWYNEKRQGLFTYFFLKAIHDFKNSDKNGDNELTFEEIFNYVSDKTEGVPYYARRLNAVEQTPVLKGNNTERVFVKFGK
ncbi:MAG: caspase family protein [Bacteroidales bacterium]